MLVLIRALDAAAAQLPDTVSFPSRDGKTQLVGYLFKPKGAGPFPAIVMLHGRAGPYSTGAKGVYSAHTLTQRHKAWGEFWAARGYLVLHVDSFGPRGYAQGFPVHSYRDRPPAVSEQTVRPLDAYGALEYLRGRGDVIADRVGVQGWSNGAMTLLATLADTAPGIAQPTPQTGFRAALALYPGCREQGKQNYRLALLADAGHILTDVGAIALSLLAAEQLGIFVCPALAGAVIAALDFTVALVGAGVVMVVGGLLFLPLVRESPLLRERVVCGDRTPQGACGT